MIKYFILKGTLVESMSNEKQNEIAEWMNNYPRKILNYKTPLEALQEEIDELKMLNKNI